MHDIHPLTHDNVNPYLLLVQPGYRRWIQESDDEMGLIILGASFWGYPVGLLLAQCGEESARLLDLYVLPNYRRAGIATALLTALEARMGVPRITALYRADEQSDPFQRCLTKQGWGEPTPSRTIFGVQASLGIAEMAWVNDFRFRPPYEVIAWADVSAEERRVIRQRGESGWYTGLSPFNRPDQTWDKKLSVALRCRGEILGWVLVIREADDQKMVEVLFIDPPLQPLGRGIMLVAEAVRRGIADGIEYGYWGVAVDNRPMLRWTRQAFAETLIDEYVEFLSEKVLST